MKEKLTNNWVLKLISVCLAISMWLIVVNENNPVENKTVTVRNVEYLNENVVVGSGKTYSVGNLETRGIDITVPVSKLDANKVKGDDFEIVVDLSKIGPYGSVEIDVKWLNPGTYTIKGDISWKTTTVTVELEDIIEKTYTVQLHTAGEPAEGYIVGENTQVTPRTVTIRAPKSVMEQIRSVGIEVNINDLSSEAAGTAGLKLYDVAGEELELDIDQFEDYEFRISEDQIEYVIPLLKTKEVHLRFEGTVGSVAEGYRFTDITGANQTVHVAGLRAVLADVEAIDIPAEVLDLDGAESNVEIQIDTSLYVPEGVTVEGESVVTVTLVVEPLVSQTRQLMPEQIRLDGAKEGFAYTIRGSVEVTIEGLEEDLNALTDEMLDAWISVADLEEGPHTVPVHVTVGTGFTLIDIKEATVTMEKIPETESQSGAGTSGGGQSGTSGSSEGSTTASGGQSESTTTAAGGSTPAGETGTEKTTAAGGSSGTAPAGRE